MHLHTETGGLKNAALVSKVTKGESGLSYRSVLKKMNKSYKGRICPRIIEPKSFFAPQWAANSVSNTKVLVNINLPSLTITHNTVNV